MLSNAFQVITNISSHFVDVKTGYLDTPPNLVGRVSGITFPMLINL